LVENIFEKFIEEKITRSTYLSGINFSRIKLATILEPTRAAQLNQMSCCVYGWGKEETLRTSINLKKVRMQILATNKCRNYIRNFKITGAPNVFNGLVSNKIYLSR